MSTDQLRQEVARLRRELDRARREVVRASAVLGHLESAADRVRRGSDAGDDSAAITAFERYLDGDGRPDSLSYLTANYVTTDGGSTTALAASRAESSGDVNGFVRDFETYVGGGSVDAATLTADFETLVTDGTADDLDALVSLFEHAVAAARGYRDDRESELNNEEWADGSPGDPGKLQAFLDSLDDELSLLAAEPVAMLPVRLETRFVYPNDGSSPRLTGGNTAADRLGDYNRTAPSETELRVRVYPDQIHVDSHEPELTVQEEQWGRNFWAQVWFACQPITERQVTEDGTQRTIHEHEFAREKVPDDLEPMLSDLQADWQERFSTDGPGFYRDIKERAWGQLTDRFGRERAAYVVHALAPKREAQAMLTGYDGSGAPFAGGTPRLEFPAVDLRPGSWTQRPRADLLPDRWIAVGHWRHKDDEEGETTRLRVTGDAIRHPLPVGPSPERLGSEESADEPGDTPPGMEWMADWHAARRAGMGLTITSDDLGGTNPSEVVFEEFVVVGVRASESGATVTDRLESLFDAHHYTDGLELLDRGTPTNNSNEKDTGYTRKDDPTESVGDECGPLLTEFGDFSDGDLLARALGIATPGEGMDHVFAHVEGADGRTQANARHMNSLLWSGTIGYYLRNLLVDNRWTDRESIWEGQSDRDAKSFPRNPKTELGETLKRMDAWRRHFIRYVRAGGPFPPIRVGKEPYGVLPAEAFSAEAGSESGGGAGIRIGRRVDDSLVTDRVRTPTGEYQIDTSRIGTDQPASGDPDVDETVDPDSVEVQPSGSGESTTAADIPAEVGQVSSSGYSVTVSEPTNQVEGDLYGSSFDPASPKKEATQPGTLATTDFSSDGGTETQTRQRAFRTDGEFPGELRTWLENVTEEWEQRTDDVARVGGGQSSPDAVDRILGREANADDFVREKLHGFDEMEAKHDWSEGTFRNTLGLPKKMRETLREYDLTGLDPRLAWMTPTISWGSSPGDLEDRPVSLVTDGRESEYLTDLYAEDVGFLQELGYPVGLDHITIDREALKSAMDWGDEIDPLSDKQLFVHLVLTEPEHGNLNELWVENTLNHADDISAEQLITYAVKLNQLRQTDGDALQNTLFKQVTRFSTIQAYVGGRIRLGLKWDTLDIESANQFLAPDPDPDAPSADEVADYEEEHGDEQVHMPDYTQQPVPDPAVHGSDTTTVWDWLDDPVPDQYDQMEHTAQWFDQDDSTYASILRRTSISSSDLDLPTVDPRMKEVFDAIEYLSERDDDDVERLFTETLDLASHRLDAWWTSLATRRLFEHRETQEADFYDGAEFEFVGDHFRRGEGTEAKPNLSSDGGDRSGEESGTDTAAMTLEGNTRFGTIENRQLNLKKSNYRLVEQSTEEEGTERGRDSGGERDRETSDAASGAEERHRTERDTETDERRTEEERTDRTDEQRTERERTERTDERRTEGESTDETGDSRAGETDDGSRAADGEASSTDGADDPTPEPVTYVGAYGYVENLHADVLDDELDTAGSADGGADSEYIHAPSPQHATTAAILRSGRANHADENDEFGEGDLAELLDVDLSPGRLRAAKQVLAGIRQGQMLGDLLGYRLERRLLEKSQFYNEHNAGRIALPTYKFALRKAFPGKEGKLERAGEGTSDGLDVGTEAAASDVLDGYDLFTTWQEKSEQAFFESVSYGDAEDEHLAAALSSAERSALVDLFEEIEAIVDAVTDLLIAENVHQIGKGNFARAGAGIDDLVDGKAVADPEVATTPREEVGVTHRLGVSFGDPSAATTDTAWSYDSPVVEPGALPNAAGSSPFSMAHSDTPLVLQARADAEPNLNAWLGDLLPDPDRISCRASLTWDEKRDFATGSVATPTSEGVVTVDDLDFQPDLVVLELAHGVPEGGTTGADGDYGVTHGAALRSPTGQPSQCSTSVGTHFDGGDAGATVSETHALDAHLHDPDGQHGRLRGSVRFTEDGFDLAFDTVRTRGPADDGLVLSYRAYALADVSNAEVGTFRADGTKSVPLSVDADHALLFGNAVATGTGAARTTTGAAGVSRGVAVADGAGVRQYALGRSVDPASGGHVAGVRDDRAVHLPFSSAGSVAGTTSLQVTGLGTSLDLSYESQHAGAAGDATRAVTYVALGTDEDVQPPEVGVVDDTRSAGDTETVTTGFEPGLVELVALPEDGGVGSDTDVTVGGLSAGAATGVGEQRTVHHSVRADGDGGAVATGTETGGDGIVLPDLAADGTADAEDVVRVTSRSADGFTLSFPAVADGNQVVAWRAWPAEPESVTHVAETGLSFDDLELSPLDATYLTQRNRKAGASQLEQRMRYHLVRNPPTHEPPVPARATADLEFDSPSPNATASDPLSIGAALEVIAGIRELVQGSRPLDAGDLGHPGETGASGYTEATVTDLQQRADKAQDRLAAAGRVLDNRVRLLDPDEDSARSLTDQVATLQDDLRAFTRDVPFDGLAVAADDLSTAGSDFLAELERLRDHLPAGSTDRDERSFDFEVAPAPDQDLGGTTGTPNATFDVELWSTSTAEWFSKATQVETDGDGVFSLRMDFSDVRPGTGFVAVLSDGASVESVRTGIVLVPDDVPTIKPAAGQLVAGVVSNHTETTLDVTVTETGASSPIRATEASTDADGRFTVTVDASGVDPWTRFEVAAATGGATVFTDEVYVEATPGRVVTESDVLSTVLWIDDRAEAFDPHRDGPTAALDDAVRDGTDWGRVRTELGAFRDLNGKTGGGESGMPPQSDIDAVDALVDDGSGPALAALDLEAVDAAVAGITSVVDDFGLAAMFDVTGRPDRAGGTRFWTVTEATEDDDRQARLSTLVDHPGMAAEGRPLGSEAGFAPELGELLSVEARGVYPRGGEDVERLVEYLRALARFLPTVIDDPALTSTLADPEGFVRGLRALLYHPEAVPTGQERSTFRSDFRKFVRQPVLGGIANVDEALEEADVDSLFYNRERALLDSRQGSVAGATRPAEEVRELKREFGEEIEGHTLVWDTGIETNEPERTPDGTPVTDCRFLLEGFRRAFLQPYLDGLDGGWFVPSEADSRSAFASTLSNRLSTLSTVVSEQSANLDAGRAAGAFDESFRRGVLETLRRAMLRVSYFGVYGSTPQSVDGGQPSDEETLVAQARSVHDAVSSRFRESSDIASGSTSGLSVDQRVDRQVARLEALFGDDFQVLPTFEPVNGAELTATFDRSEALQEGDPMAAETWLQRAARVREESATFRRALSYAETVTKVRHRDLRVGQVPHRRHESWVGLDGQDPEPGRLSLVMQEAAGFDGTYDAGGVAGLFVDEFVESVPGETETTGVAINYDDPDATAPHSVLLALPHEQGGWSTDHLSTVVSDTMRLARCRLVDLEDLGEVDMNGAGSDPFGPLLPMLAFPKNDALKPDAPSVDVDRIERYHRLAPEWWKVQLRAKRPRLKIQVETTTTKGGGD